MNAPSEYVFKLGFMVALNNGKIFIQIGEKLIDLASLSPALQRSIEKALRNTRGPAEDRLSSSKHSMVR